MSRGIALGGVDAPVTGIFVSELFLCENLRFAQWFNDHVLAAGYATRDDARRGWLWHTVPDVDAMPSPFTRMLIEYGIAQGAETRSAE